MMIINRSDALLFAVFVLARIRLGESLPSRHEAQHHDVPGIGRRRPEARVGAVKSVQDAEHPETVVESTTEQTQSLLVSNIVLCYCYDAYFKWWKSCASGDGKKGRW